MSKVVRILHYEYDVDAKPLGTGGFGKVYAGIDIRTNTPVAIKVISLAGENQQYITWFEREISILQFLVGKYVLKLKDVVQSKSEKVYMITNLCNGGSLETILTLGRTLSEDQALKMLSQVAEAFVDLQNDNMVDQDQQKIIIVHRDLKPGNILFHEGDVCIADFGLAKHVKESAKEAREKHTVLGTPHYMSPQILGENNYSTKCDIWSMGVVMYESLFGKKPWDASSTYRLLESIRKNLLKFPPETPISEDTQKLIESMLQIQEDNRIDWEGILNHPVIAKLKEKNKEEKTVVIGEEIRSEDENLPNGEELKENERIRLPTGLTDDQARKAGQKISNIKIEEERKANFDPVGNQLERQINLSSCINLFDANEANPNRSEIKPIGPEKMQDNLPIPSVGQIDVKCSQGTKEIVSLGQRPKGIIKILESDFEDIKVDDQNVVSSKNQQNASLISKNNDTSSHHDPRSNQEIPGTTGPLQNQIKKQNLSKTVIDPNQKVSTEDKL